MRRRRQTGGLVPYSVTLRLRGALLALRVCAAVLAMILISHRGAADLGLLRAACDAGKRVVSAPNRDGRRTGGGDTSSASWRRSAPRPRRRSGRPSAAGGW